MYRSFLTFLVWLNAGAALCSVLLENYLHATMWAFTGLVFLSVVPGEFIPPRKGVSK